MRTEHPPIGPRRSAPPKNMPEGFVAPYDAFEPRFIEGNHVAFEIIGVQAHKSETDVREVIARIDSCLAESDGPNRIEYGQTLRGKACEVRFCYWQDPAQHRAWAKQSKLEEVLGDEAYLSSPFGLWRESCLISLDHNETSYSRRDDLTGFGHFADALEVTPVHAYWGSARDRVVAAADDDLNATAKVQAVADDYGLGRRVTVTAPANSCLIRSTQDLTVANDAQLRTYTIDVRQTLIDGIAYLENNRIESGCAGIRYYGEENSSGDRTMRTSITGFFDSLASLEKWTHTHSTHNAIMAAFMTMVEQYQGEPGLHLWHEITVFPDGTLFGDYVNCSAEGTLMGLGQNIRQKHHQLPGEDMR